MAVTDLLVHGQKVTRDSADLGQDETVAPDLSLVLETVGSDHLELGVETLLVIGTPRSLGGLGKVTKLITHHFCFLISSFCLRRAKRTLRNLGFL